MISHVKSKEQNKQTKQKLTRGYREQTDSCQMGGRGVRGLGEKGEGIKKYKLADTKQLWGCKVHHREYSQ